MSIVYVLSVVYLIVLFMMYKKSEDKICFMSSFIYTMGLLFCYNTFIVFLLYLLGIKGSLLIFSIINFLVGTLIGVIVLKREKSIQKYYFDKRKILIGIIVSLVIFLIGYYRFRGFEAISFESGDSAIHYSHAIKFSEELSILDRSNSKDEVFGAFVRVMPISYVNCGLLFNLTGNIKSYVVFMLYNIGCLILSTLLFMITVIDVFKLKRKDYVYALILSLFYTLSFPLNSFILGFCYLGLSIMVINLLYLTINSFKDKFNKDISFKLIIILLITFSIFCSYYLFVPAIYLALGLYYIYLYKKKAINLKQLFIYGIITLVIPFIIGFSYFFITLFLDSGVEIVATLIGSWGYTYDSITPMYLFIFSLVYLVYDYRRNKDLDYLRITLYVFSFYIIIFLLFYIFKVAAAYYFYKLFYVYWLLLILYLCKKIYDYRHIFYIGISILFSINLLLFIFNDSKVAELFSNTNIYSWNTYMFSDSKILFDKDEVKLIEKSREYEGICKEDNKFLVLGAIEKNIWYYSITGNVPVYGNVNGNVKNLYIYNVMDFNHWRNRIEYDCLIYYYEDEVVNIDINKYDVLYENNKGAIIKRKSLNS